MLTWSQQAIIFLHKTQRQSFFSLPTQRMAMSLNMFASPARRVSFSSSTTAMRSACPTLTAWSDREMLPPTTSVTVNSRTNNQSTSSRRQQQPKQCPPQRVGCDRLWAWPLLYSGQTWLQTFISSRVCSDSVLVKLDPVKTTANHGGQFLNLKLRCVQTASGIGS